MAKVRVQRLSHSAKPMSAFRKAERAEKEMLKLQTYELLYKLHVFGYFFFFVKPKGLLKSRKTGLPF